MVDAYIVVRVPVNVNKYPDKRAGYLTHRDTWREYQRNEETAIDILPHIFASQDDAQSWIMRNSIRSYNYCAKNVSIQIHSLVKGVYVDVTEEKEQKRFTDYFSAWKLSSDL